MFWNKKESHEAQDEDQKEYRDFFAIQDKFLINYFRDEKDKIGYIVFID